MSKLPFASANPGGGRGCRGRQGDCQRAKPQGQVSLQVGPPLGLHATSMLRQERAVHKQTHSVTACMGHQRPLSARSCKAMNKSRRRRRWGSRLAACALALRHRAAAPPPPSPPRPSWLRCHKVLDSCPEQASQAEAGELNCCARHVINIHCSAGGCCRTLALSLPSLKKSDVPGCNVQQPQCASWLAG